MQVKGARISAKAGEMGRSDSDSDSDLDIRPCLNLRVQVLRGRLSPRHLRIRDHPGVSGWYLRLLSDRGTAG